MKNLYISKGIIPNIYKRAFSVFLAIIVTIPIITYSLSNANAMDFNSNSSYLENTTSEFNKMEVGKTIGSCFIDENFARAIYANILKNDANSFDMNYQLTYNDITAIKYTVKLDVDYMNIYTLNGIQNLEGLRYLSCVGNNLEILPNLPNKLAELYCQRNLLAELSNLPSGLRYLDCSSNCLINLPTLPYSLQYLACQSNYLNQLDTSFLTELKTLLAYDNNLTSINVFGCINLTKLDCHNNRLNSLNTSNLVYLKKLIAYCNAIKTLDVSQCVNLKMIDIHNNVTSSVDIKALGCSCYCKVNCFSNKNSVSSISINNVENITHFNSL